jgi:dimethylargininase
MLTALVRVPSRALPDCELSFLDRVPIDVGQARVQHRAYQAALREAGARVTELPPLDDLPDATVAEDAAIVLDECAVLAPMGAASRQPESVTMAAALAPHRRITWLQAPATLDGGDVLRLGRSIYVGQTPRTNTIAVTQLRALAEPLGYTVTAVPISRCLHLKSACARLDDRTVLVNPDWIEPAVFGDRHMVPVARGEEWGANAVRVGDTIIFPSSAPATQALVAAQGFRTAAVDVSELQKAEAGVTCLSLVFDSLYDSPSDTAGNGA